ncbi:hypothetical protein NBRC10513v2_000849 [Rhodotorula toruloides]|uniref:Uncharacterized protein n=1 Tax=Rhodotorula toruloides TaxID=5286 RepID=A0A0K3C6Q5_RHOTO|nr:hypothetical protein AAT19DRAFT_8379 [Rhodotorula toruloides]
MSNARVRLPDNAFYRQSRLAAPPLMGDWPVEEIRQFVPGIRDEHDAKDILQRFYDELKPLCDEVLAALHSTSFGHGELEGFVGTDAQWFRQIIDGLVSVFEYVLEEGDAEDKIIHVEALESKLRADVEKHPYEWRTKARTVAEFIISTLREVRVQALSQHINRELLWHRLASLKFIDGDMLAWRLYCRDATGPAWRRKMGQLAADEREFLIEHRRRVERGRQRGHDGEFALAKREFVPVGRREAARW